VVAEFAGPVDAVRLGAWLEGAGFDPEAYWLDGGHPSEKYLLDHRGHEWVVYYSERGLETGLRSFPSEDLACCQLADLLVRDPAAHRHRSRPGQGAAADA
jgi:hypothetical protein